MTDPGTPNELRQARYQRACWWLAQDVDLVPLKPRSKQIQPGYGVTKAHITTSAFAAKWFQNTDANLGVVLGPPTGLAVVDWDDPQTYRNWLDTTGATVTTLTEQTARGYHSFFFVKELPSGASPGYEFKTRGVCMVSPSRHSSGAVYQIIKEAPILTLDEEETLTLFPFLSERLRQKFGNGNEKTVVDRLFKKEGLSARASVIARIKAARSIVDEMQATGLDLQWGGKQTLVGLCPFHDDHSPSLWANPESGLWGCNKPTCPATGIHDVINFRALTRNISNNAAIKQMASEFLEPNLE